MQNSPKSRLKLLEKTLILTPQDTGSHKEIEFSVPKDVECMIIEASYTPKVFRDKEKSLELARRAMEHYDFDMNDNNGKSAEDQSRLLNLIIISVDMNGKYLGAAHRHLNKQRIVLSHKEATPGFHANAIEPGHWKIAVSVFLVLTQQCIYRLKVTGITGDSLHKRD